MKASIEWLKEYSDIDVTPTELGDILTMTGSKVETIDEKGNDIKNVGTLCGTYLVAAKIFKSIDT